MTIADWAARQVAELDATIALHKPDADGRCARCVRVGLFYDRSPCRWPCGAYDLAVRERARLLSLGVPRQRRPVEDRTAA